MRNALPEVPGLLESRGSFLPRLEGALLTVTTPKQDVKEASQTPHVPCRAVSTPKTQTAFLTSASDTSWGQL